jgi:3-deoxy-D-manno-octulosonic-acid transferase
LYLLYSLGLGLAFVLAAPFYLLKGGRSAKYVRNCRARLGRVPAEVRSDRPGSVWVHAVSVGEVLTARVLVAALKARFPERPVFVSTTTPTGHEVARRTLDAADGVFYAPFDFAFAVRRVLGRLRPALLVLVETEIWPNLIHEARRRGARVAVVNGRLSPRSFPRYRLVRALLARVLAEVDLFLMQGEPHAERARAIGAPGERVRVTGNLKFDALPSGARPAALAAVFNGAAGEPVWIAGSTVAGEEEAVLQAFRALRASVGGARLVLAPRHPERFGAMAPLVAAAGLSAARRSALEGRAWAGEDVLILDTLGELAHVYAFGTVVFVGGSLVAAGGHNVLEPAVAGKATVVGPHMENFQEIADEFLAAGALVQVERPEDLGRAIVRLFTTPDERERIGARARDLVQRNRGAVQATVEALAGLVA